MDKDSEMIGWLCNYMDEKNLTPEQIKDKILTGYTVHLQPNHIAALVGPVVKVSPFPLETIARKIALFVKPELARGPGRVALDVMAQNAREREHIENEVKDILRKGMKA